MRLPTQLLHIALPKEIIAKIDEEARQTYINRSEFVRRAIVEKLRQTTTNALPGVAGINILMTDKQLEDLMQTLQVEKRRRGMWYRGY